MDKSILGVGAGLVLGGAVAAMVVLGGSMGGGATPALAGSLETEHTIGVLGVTGMDGLAAQAMAAIDTLRGSQDGDLAAMLEPSKWTGSLGFDPSKAEAWTKIGIDPAAGMAVVWDRRVVEPTSRAPAPLPIVLLEVTDEEALLKFLGGHLGKRPQLKETPGGWRKARLDEFRAVVVGKRGEHTAVLMTSASDDGVAKIGVQFAAFLRAAGAQLADDDTFKAALGGADKATGGFYGYLQGGPAGDALISVARHDNQKKGAQHYQRLFAGASARGDATSGQLRLLTTAEGQKVLAQIGRSRHGAPSFASRIPRKGWGAARVTVNLEQLFAGLVAVAPPTMRARDRARLEGLKGVIAVATGVAWAEFEAALTGHAAVAVDIASLSAAFGQRGPAAARGLLMLGVADEAKADGLLSSLVHTVKSLGGPAATELEVAGAKAYSIAAGPAQIVAARAGKLLFAAVSKDGLEAAINPSGETLAGTRLGEQLDGDNVLSYGLDMTPLFDVAPLLLSRSGGDAAAAGTLKTLRAAVPEEDPFTAISIALDQHGLRMDAHSPGPVGGGVSMAAAFAAAAAIPQLRKYQRQARLTEVGIMMDAIKEGARAYAQTPRVDASGKKLPCAFPPTVDLTPAGSSCCDPELDRDGDKRCDVAPASWQRATWRALGFSLTEPHRFQYAFRSEGVGNEARYYIDAHADMDCDGIKSTFHLVGSSEDGDCQTITTAIFRDNETE